MIIVIDQLNCKSELQKRTANCKSELQKRTAKVNCRSVVELRNEPQTQNEVGVYLRATVVSLAKALAIC